ncbi:MAG: polyphosphate kinase 1 [Pirellulales bacterium]|nr:polyphosphate kinase 1 [Pirellulales bacterium]
MPKDPLKSPELYINRELSWLEFNQRVLEEGLDSDLPLLERLKFLAIVNSNLDEFFLVRVAWLMQRRAKGERRRDISGMTPAEQFKAVGSRVQQMVDQQAAGVRDVFVRLAEHGLKVWNRDQWTEEHQKFVRSYFTREIQPILTPLAIEELTPEPLLPNLQLHVAALLANNAIQRGQSHFRGGKAGSHNDADGAAKIGTVPDERVVVVPVPSQLPRWVALPSETETHLARVEDVIAANIEAMFPGSEVFDTAAFRVTRDADVVLQDDEEIDDLLHEMEEVVLSRRRRNPVRLTISAGSDPKLRRRLADWLKLRDRQVYEVNGPQEASALMELVERPGFDDQRIDDWPPQIPRDLIGTEDLWEAIQDHDVLLFHPYESFDPVVKLVQQAAEDPQVLAIKQTLYRTSGESPIVRALAHAAAGGKEVTVLVELKARFDEWRNVNWARRPEDAGVHVIYGVAGFKTLAKALLIVRRQQQRIVRYVHLATGNYNDRTARQYSDVGLMTCDREIAADVASLFNLLTGCSEAVGWTKLAVAPIGLRQKFLDLIEREIQASSADRPGLIMAKVNSLQDPDICRALCRASQAGVKVMLNVRGICCLRPGVAGVSENVEVRSIVDRFLEHARMFYFRNGGHEEVYLSSADWMRRNLGQRLELLFPVIEPGHRRRLIDVLRTYFADNVKSWRLLSDGTYEKVVGKGRRVRAQGKFYRAAVAAVRDAAHAVPQFRPLTRPKPEE